MAKVMRVSRHAMTNAFGTQRALHRAMASTPRTSTVAFTQAHGSSAEVCCPARHRTGMIESQASMVSKLVESLEAAVAGIEDGAVIMIGGFGAAGMPSELIHALIAQGARDLTIVNNNAGNGDTGLAALLKMRRVKRIICSFPR